MSFDAKPKNAFAEVTFDGCDWDGTLITGSKPYPCYTCGHCSNVVLMRDDRERARKMCLRCMKWICEKGDICATHCTPLHALAADHFETKGDAGLYVRAIMAGVSDIKEAHEKGLVGDI